MKNYLNYILEKTVDKNYSIDNEIKIRTDKTADRYKNAMNILNLDDAVSFCLNNCKEFIDDPKIITRNMDTNENYFSSKPVERFSRDNINNYTLMIDNSKKWSKFPKRSKAFICSSHFYSKFYVIPTDNSKWGICSKNDIYYSFEKLRIINKYNRTVTSIKQFFEDLTIIAHNFFGIKISDIDFEEMKKDLESLSIALSKIEDEEIIEGIKSATYGEFIYNLRNKNLFDEIEKLMDPYDNNFTLITYKDYVFDIKFKDKEMWTDSECLFINRDFMANFLKKLPEETQRKWFEFKNLY